MIAAFFVATMAYGVQYSFGIFLKPLTEEFGWSRAAVSGAVSLFMFVRGVMAILTGWATDKYGPRITIAAGGFLLGLGLLLTSQINAIWQLYLFYGLLVGFGLSIAFAPLVATTSRWFVKKRGLAIGIVVSGVGMGTVVMSPVADYLISSYGWRPSYIIISILAWVIILSAAYFLKRSPEDSGLLPLGGVEESPTNNSAMAQSDTVSGNIGFSLLQAMRTSAFWILLAIIVFWALSVQMTMIHLYPHVTDVGISGAVAARFLIIIGVFSIIGRLAMGGISDKLGGRPSLGICLVLLALSMFWLTQSTEIWMFYVFAVVFGFAYAGCVPLLPVIAGELFKLRSIGAVVGVQMVGVAIGGAIGPILAGYVFDVSGSYGIAFSVGAGSVIVSLALLFLLSLARKKLDFSEV